MRGLKLGPELFDLLNSRQVVAAPTSPIYGKGGASPAQIRHIEEQLGFSLPPDFAYLLQNLRDPGGTFFPWTNFKREDYDGFVGWVWQGIARDIELNSIWLRRWGEAPESVQDAIEIARADFDTWPRLLPISGHRCLVADPCEAGNPVFSIMQTDIIYYGADLANYLVSEFVDPAWIRHLEEMEPRHIAVWSDFADESIELLSTKWDREANRAAFRLRTGDT